MKKYLSIALSTVAATMLWSCGNTNNWIVEGSIEGADSTTLLLEAPGINGWYVLDSVLLDKGGDFEFVQPAVGYPEIFRLNANNHKVYFPIDSIETITFKGYASAIDSGYTLEGSSSAEKMAYVDKKIASIVAEKGERVLVSDSLLKRELSEIILGDNEGLLSYYIINKRVGNTTIFDVNDKRDLRIIGAVANKFNQMRPKDSRTESLKKMFLKNRNVSMDVVNDTIHVAQTALFDIRLYDNKGELHSLKDVASKGNVTILNFTLYQSEQSPAYNIILNEIYETNKSLGLEIYQVSVDKNESLWKESAENLPWITVYNSPNDGAKNLINYNVNLLPALFVIDRNGDLAERVDDITKLKAIIKKYL
jgi:hypothetical protein